MAGMTVQPIHKPKLDLSNPLVPNLIASFNAGSGPVELVQGGVSTGRGPNQTIRDSIHGIGYDNRAVNSALFFDAVEAAKSLVVDHTMAMDVVFYGAPGGSVPAIGGAWSSATQNNALLVLERTSADILNLSFAVGPSTRGQRTFDIGLSALYGRKLTLVVSASRTLPDTTVRLRVFSDNALLYDLVESYFVTGSPVPPLTGTEYFSIGSEQIENPSRNSNCVVLAQHHFNKVLSLEEATTLAVNPWQFFEAPEPLIGNPAPDNEEYEIAPRAYQPQGYARIDAGNPTARGMRMALNAGSGFMNLVNLRTMTPAPKAGGPVEALIRGTPQGVAFNQSGTNAGFMAPTEPSEDLHLLDQATILTYFVVTETTGAGDADGRGLFVNGGSEYIGLGSGLMIPPYANQKALRATWRQANYTSLNLPSTGLILVPGMVVCAIQTFQRNGLCQLYVNGQVLSSATAVDQPLSLDNLGVKGVQVSYSNRLGVAQTLLGCTWGRLLSPGEIASLSANPWQLFENSYISDEDEYRSILKLLYSLNGGMTEVKPGLAAKPLVMVNGIMRERAGSEGQPVVLDEKGYLRTVSQ